MANNCNTGVTTYRQKAGGGNYAIFKKRTCALKGPRPSP
jgi:hypothetical protein